MIPQAGSNCAEVRFAVEINKIELCRRSMAFATRPSGSTGQIRKSMFVVIEVQALFPNPEATVALQLYYRQHIGM